MQKENVSRGAAYLSIQNIIGYIFSFIFYLLIARVLSPTDVGKLSLLLMISSIFVLTNPSIQFFLQRFIPIYIEKGKKKELGDIIQAGLTVLVATSTPILIILILSSSIISTIIFGSTAETWLIIIMLLASFGLNLVAFLGGEMLGLGLFKEIAIQNLLNTGTSRILAIPLVLFGFGLLGVPLGWLIGAMITIGFSVYILRNDLKFKKGFPIKKVLAFCLPIHIFTIITFIQTWADLGILYALAPDLSQIGVYYLVVSGALILAQIYIPISMVILPALSSRYATDGLDGLLPMATIYIRMAYKILIPIGFSFAALSSTAIEVAFGQQYTSGAIPFAILAAASIIPALLILIITIFQSIGNTKPLIIIGITASIVDILIVGIFASNLGGIAGAMGRTSFSIVGLIIGYYYLRKKIKLPIFVELKKSLIATASIATPLYIIDQIMIQIINIPLRLRAPIDILLFIVLTLAFAYFTDYLTKEDFELIKKPFPKKTTKIINRLENIFLSKK